jgi:hypothetical protein
MISNAFAVHDLVFQLDGDVVNSTQTCVGDTDPAPGCQNHIQTLDWDSIFTDGTLADPPTKEDPLPTNFTAATFARDFNHTGTTFETNDQTTFATGSKDTLAITPGWQCNFDANVNSKIDVMNGYAAAYTDTRGTANEADDHDILYFALERNINTGDANVGFWFLQDEVGCSSEGGSEPFTGDHKDGDLLIVSAFTKGGTVSTIDVYRWNDPDPNDADPGSIGTTPVAHGVDCKATSGGDDACATVNTGTISTPWFTSNKQDGVGHSLRTSEFFEGGLDLTENNLSGKCFNTFMADTRSSQSLTATLFDYSLGKLGECTSTTVTDPVESDGTTPLPTPPAGVQIPGDPNDAAINVKDKATITVTGADTFSGTLTFHLCGPTAADATALCDSGGVAIGSAQTITASGDYTSATATVTAAGRYCWRADFSGDSSAGVPKSSDSSASECFIVTPRTPALVTDAGAVGSDDPPVDFGQPVTDTAVLSNTAHQPGTGGPTGSDGSINPTTLGGDADGSIKFTLYKDATCTTPATGTGTNPQTVTVSGNGTYGPVSFTPDAPGTYYWVAEYDGDLPNTTAASDTACDDADEKVVVRQIPTEIATSQSVYPNDSATVTSSVSGNDLPADGDVVFRLFGSAGGNDGLANCLADDGTDTSTGLLYHQTVQTGAAAHQVTVNTTNTSVAVDASDVYYWRVTYDPGDSAHTGRQSNCSESTDLTFTNDAGPGTLFP